MEETRHKDNADLIMLERAQQMLELTYHEWRLHERPQRKVHKVGVMHHPDTPLHLHQRWGARESANRSMAA